MIEIIKDKESIIISGKNGNTLDLRHVLNQNALADQKIICEELVIIKDLILDEVEFSCIDFTKGLCLKNCRVGKIYSTSSYFGKSDDNMSFEFIDMSFASMVLSNCTFNGDVYITSDTNNKTKVNLIELEDCSISGNVYVRDILLNVDGQISLNGSTNLMGDLEFRDFMIIRGVLDLRTTILGELRLYSINNVYAKQCQHLNKPYLSDIEFHESDINLVRVYNSNINRIYAENTIIGNIIQQNTVIEVLQKDAPRLFRDAAIKNNDEFLSLKYTGEVYDRYLKENAILLLKPIVDKIKGSDSKCELQPKLKVSQNWRLLMRLFEPLILFLCSFFSSDRLLLWLNKYSNDFNRSWSRGVFFTAVVTLLSYFILNYCGMESQYFIIDFKCNDFNKVFLGYLSLLDIAGWSDSKDIFQLTPSGKIIIFFAKLLITYGIWQTIYAFYKYKK